MALAPVEIGKYNQLEVLKETPQGLYLGDTVEEILLPTKFIPEGTEVGDVLEVFIYNDSEDRIIATTQRPYAVVDEFACLRVKDTTTFGAFLSWGIEKDLMVPFSEQKDKMERGEYYLVYIYLDDVTDRLVASSKLHKFLSREPLQYHVGDEVQLVIGDETPLGFQVIVDQQYLGLVYHNEIFKPIRPGDQIRGYVKQTREDLKIDVSLQPIGIQGIDQIAQGVLTKLKDSGGYLPLHDKSDPDDIQKTLHLSKKSFKKAIGSLYKNRIIQIEKEGIRLVSQ